MYTPGLSLASMPAFSPVSVLNKGSMQSLMVRSHLQNQATEQVTTCSAAAALRTEAR